MSTTSRRNIIETVHVGALRYQLERVRCGKPRCRWCSAGGAHGPYWYAYERHAGRTARSYHGVQTPSPVEPSRQRERAARRRAQALEHDAVIDVLIALEALGETSWQADEHNLDELTDDDIGPERALELDVLADDLEAAVDELRDVTRAALRRIRRRITRHRRPVAEAEELLAYQ